jgi:exopolysaccharide biosynthesis WecB/TagA/CpsF family protein
VVVLHEGQDEHVKERFREAYKAAALCLCDSRILELLAKFRGVRLNVVTGSDLTALLFASGQLNGKRVAIVGGDQAMIPELNERFPGIELVQHIPPMGVLHKPDAIAEIEAFLASAACDYVLLAIGSPQSEVVAHQCLKAGQARGVALCIGASIEFVLGRKARAPLWMQRTRLEWAFRLMSEPKRLWRRYLAFGPKIVRLTFK